MSGMALGDQTFFDWHGVTAVTKYNEAKNIIKSKCKRVELKSHPGVHTKIISGFECGRHPYLGIQTPEVVFEFFKRGFFSERALIEKRLFFHENVFQVNKSIIKKLKKNQNFKQISDQKLKRTPLYEGEGLQACGDSLKNTQELPGSTIETPTVLDKEEFIKCGFEFRFKDTQKAVRSILTCYRFYKSSEAGILEKTDGICSRLGVSFQMKERKLVKFD